MNRFERIPLSSPEKSPNPKLDKLLEHIAGGSEGQNGDLADAVAVMDSESLQQLDKDLDFEGDALTSLRGVDKENIEAVITILKTYEANKDISDRVAQKKARTTLIEELRTYLP